MPFCLSVPHHHRQPIQSHALVPLRRTSSSSTLQSHALVPFRPTSSSSALQSHALLPFHFIQHFVPPLRFFSPCPRPSGKVPGFPAKTVHFPPVADRDTGSTCLSGGTCRFHPWGKCRVFRRKRFTFTRGSQGHRLHRPLSRHLPFPPPGKVPGISAKTVHFPPWPTRAPAPQASLAALGISTPGESAGNFRKNGSLSPVAGRGIGSTGLSCGTWHFHLPGKCREFLRKRFTFPRSRPGYRLHRPLSRHLPFLPLGKVPGIPAKTVHFPPWPTGALAPQASLAALGISTSRESAGNSCENGSLSPAAGRGAGSTDPSGRTWHFHPRGKCREFLRKRFTFPRGSQGHWLHRPLSPHLQSPPLGKVPGISAKTVHFPPRHETLGEVQQGLLGKVPSIQAL